LENSGARVCLLGLGHTGYPLARLIAAAGFDVIGVDIDPVLVRHLQQGGPHPIYDGLGVQFPAERGTLRVTSTPEFADVFIVAVPTSLRRRPDMDRREADLIAVNAAIRGIVSILRPGNLLVLASTLPPGATAGLRVVVEQSGLRCGLDVFLAYCPQRILPGPTVIAEMTATPLVVGADDPESTARAVDFFQTFLPVPIRTTDTTTAEFVKLLENAYRDVNIALANEFALIAESLGVNGRQAIAMANQHPRVNIATPGPGVGGSCVPVTPYFLLQSAPTGCALIRTARKLNDAMPQKVAAEALAMLDPGGGRRVAALGISYKANVGDVRMSPALTVVTRLRAEGLDVAVHDPHAPGHNMPLEQVLHQADLLLLLVDHEAYRELLLPGFVAEHIRAKRIYDACGFFGPEWRQEGFEVRQLGVRNASGRT
jgi:UDP-N-acetyl-D-mannosaminuronic acid dehydrogenase